MGAKETFRWRLAAFWYAETLPVSGRTSLDAEANGRETMLHQALSIRLDISSRSACVYRLVITDVLLQTPAAQELLPGGELSEQSWWP